MAETEITGLNMICYHDGVAILGKRNVSLKITADTIDARHAGTFPHPNLLPGEYSWAIDVDGVNKMDGANDDTALDTLEVGMTTAALITDITFAKNGKVYSGNLAATSLTYQGEYKGVGQYSVSAQGAGQLSIA
jgi:predicted secreted protein